MGLKENSFDYLYQSVCNLLDQLDIPKNLKDIGVDETHIDRLAEKAMGDSAFATNPRNATLDEMKKIITDSVLEGR